MKDLDTHRDLNRSRPLDVHRWSEYPEVNQWVNGFWEEHLEARFPAAVTGKKAKKPPKAMFKVLFLDLYVAWLDDPDLSIGISRDVNAYKVNSRYNALYISEKIIDVLDALLELGFADQYLGSENAGKVTRIWPLPPLIEYFKLAAFAEYAIDTHEGKETVILNKKEAVDADDLDTLDDATKAKTIAIEYEDTDSPVIIPSRELLRGYHALLRQAFIDLSCMEQPVVETEYWNGKRKRWETRRVSLKQHNKFVRRIFYRGDWSLGGRFHGGWWQQIPSALRKFIRINDEITQELDYSGFHVSLAYALEGQQPPEDPYRLATTLDDFDADTQRDIVKSLVLMAINAKNEAGAFKAFRNDWNKTKDKPEVSVKMTDKLLRHLLEVFRAENDVIDLYLCTDKGVELMALDGRITAHIIETFTELGMPVLTVHDSYVVQQPHQELLEKTMDEACQKELGRSDFKIKPSKTLTPRLIQTLKNQDRTLKDYDYWEALREQEKVVAGYATRYEHFRKWLEDSQED